MNQAFICDAIRTPFGRYGGALSGVRTDDLGAVPLRALMARNPNVDWEAVTDVLYGCANQAGEDNRNVAHMSGLLAGLPLEVPGGTINRLCGSGLDAVGTAARAIKAGEAGLMIAGGVESMSRAPFVMPKAESAFSRNNAVYDTTIGWRFVNKLMKAQYGVDSMPETAENVATDFKIEREAQDRMALASQMRACGRAAGLATWRARSAPVSIPQKKGDAAGGGHATSTRARPAWKPLAKLKGCGAPRRHGDRRQCQRRERRRLCALLAGRRDHGRAPERPDAQRARVVAMATAGVAPRIMGIGPAPATQQGAGPGRADAGPDGRDRAERGLRRPGPGRAAPAGAEGRRRARQRLGRRHRAGPPTGGQRRPPGHHLPSTGCKPPAGVMRCATMCIGVGQGIALVIERV